METEKQNKTERMTLYLTKKQVEDGEELKEKMMRLTTQLGPISNNEFLGKLINVGLKRVGESVDAALSLGEAPATP